MRWLVLVSLLIVGCGQGSSETRQVLLSDVVFEVPPTIIGATEGQGWRGASAAGTRCGPTRVTVRPSATRVRDSMTEEGARCTTLTHVRSIEVDGTYWVLRCEMNFEDDGLTAAVEPCISIVSSLQPR